MFAATSTTISNPFSIRICQREPLDPLETAMFLAVWRI